MVLVGLRLVKPYTHCILMRKKNVSAPATFPELIALAGTCMSHNAALQEKTLHHSVLLSFSTCHQFQNKLTMSTEVPLYILPNV